MRRPKVPSWNRATTGPFIIRYTPWHLATFSRTDHNFSLRCLPDLNGVIDFLRVRTGERADTYSRRSYTLPGGTLNVPH